MINQLTIKNLAIIDDLSIDFDDHLTILTGETGAGKSIIIDALSMVFGSRANNEIIAYDKDFAQVSASLTLDEAKANLIYDLCQIDCKDECILSRTLNKNGKNLCKINGEIVPLKTLNEISSLLIDISGQNESLYLLNHANHLSLLNSYILGDDKNYNENYLKIYEEYNNLNKEYEALKNKNIDENELEFLNFQYAELKDYNLSIEDEENIVKEYKNNVALENNANLFEEVISFLDADKGATNLLYEATKSLNKVASNELVNDYLEKFNSLYLDLNDLVSSFKHDFSSTAIDENRMNYLSDCITKMNRLKRKYKVNDLLAFKEELANKMKEIAEHEMRLSHLKKLVDEAYKKVIEAGNNLVIIMQKYASKLEKQVVNELKDLYLNDATFEIRFTLLDKPTKYGLYDVEFYMSANKGVPPMPLIKIASGGEVSRIMLGLKAIFTKLSFVDLIVFDEIDTGVSGKVALAMGKKMEKIALNAQVLAITHLPQVAAMSDHHFYISKIIKDNKTITNIKALNKEEKVLEVSRLLSGNEISENFINAAKDLINLK